MVEAARARDTVARHMMVERDRALAYAIRAADAVKFGKTQGRMEKRLTALQTSSPVDLELLGAIEGPAGLECAIHWHLKDAGAHLRGEWYSLGHPSVAEVIKFMVSKDLEGLQTAISY